MALLDKEKNSSSSTGLVVVLVALASAVLIPHLPLTSSRPPTTEKVINRYIELQDVEARLWQDPLAAADAHEIEIRELIHPPNHDPKSLANKIHDYLLGPDLNHITVMPVMIFGDPYAEDAESRRRSRYAMLAALSQHKFAPENAKHLGYIRFPDGELPAIVPYEWFARPLERDRRILLLWLDENRFGVKPLRKLANLLSDLGLCEKSTGSVVRNNVDVRIVGPQGSGQVLAMMEELDSYHAVPSTIKDCLHDIRMYSMATTVTSEGRGFLARDAIAREATRVGITFRRTILPDEDLMHALVKELENRGWRRNEGRVAIVSEWDTQYGRILPRTAGRSFCPDEPAQKEKQCERVVLNSYLRGLDGIVPTTRASAPPPRGRGSAEKEQESAANKQSSSDKQSPSDKQSEKDIETLERAQGNSQFDYLRRLAASLRVKEPQQREIKAIGVLGSDPYDKLLVLQALRDGHENALFFTTDLDARFLHPQEYPWARNVLVVSSFGLQLHNTLQGDVPPFRDSYQTATFFATLIALNDLAPECSSPSLSESSRNVGGKRRCKGRTPEISQEYLSRLMRPQLFEIGRTSAFNLSKAALTDTCENIHRCSSIYPMRRLGPTVSWQKLGLGGLVALLGLALLWASSSVVRRICRRCAGAAIGVYVEKRRLFWIAVVGLGAIGGLIALGVLKIIDDGDRVEPFALFEGVSMWPSEALRLLAVILSVAFIVATRATLKANRNELTEAFFLGENLEYDRGERPQGAFRRLWWSVQGIFAGARWPADDKGDADSVRLWLDHLQCSAGWRYWVRILSAGALFYGFAFALISLWGTGRPLPPFRGPAARDIDQVLLLAFCVPGFIVLLFIVADAIRLCDKFTQYLAKRGRTQWPGVPLARYEGELGVNQADLAGWTDVRFLTLWTKTVNPLIYYPSIVIGILLLSRSSVFDNWNTPPGLIVVFLVSFIYLIASAVTLRLAAERTRAEALRDLTKRVISAGRSGDQQHRVKQLETMIAQIESVKDGAFAPFTQQPLVRAAILPLSGAGGIALIQFLLR